VIASLPVACVQHSLVVTLQGNPPHGTVPVVPGATPDDDELLLEPARPEEEPTPLDEEPAPLDDELTGLPDEEPPTTPEDDPGFVPTPDEDPPEPP
jgi:hypothetical protein